MLTSAKLSNILFGFLWLNAALVLAVPALRLFAHQKTDDSAQTGATAPEVQVPPDDVPSLRIPGDKVSVLPANNTPLELDGVPTGALPSNPVTVPAPSAPPNPMVLDEIRKVIQDSRGELDVPPLSYPPLTLKTGQGTSRASLDDLALRMQSISALTQAAQSLVKEARHLEAKGRASAAAEIVAHVQSLRAILVQLAADEAETSSTNHLSN